MPSAPGAAPLPGLAGGLTLPGAAGQVLRVLAPVHDLSSGGQSITISLHPAELGTVRATLDLEASQLVVRLAPTSPLAEAAIRQALPELQSGLAGNGTAATVVVVPSGLGGGAAGGGAAGGGAAGGGSGQPQGQPAPFRSAAPAPALPVVPSGPARAPATTASPDSLLDLRL